jgi:diguanylate cyclase (GGDEF)-like protein
MPFVPAIDSIGSGTASGSGSGSRSGSASATGALRTISPAQIAQSLAPTLQPEAAHTGASRTAGAAVSARAAASVTRPARPARPDVIERFVRFVPDAIWYILAAALALATVCGSTAMWAGWRVRRQASEFAAVAAAALTDPLTGVLNRRGFVGAVERELARAQRYGRSFAVAYVDVRGLKAVNDSQGHLVGDELLKNVARLLTDSARADDVVGRIGGDELGVLLVEQGPEGAAAVASRIRAQVPRRRSASGIRARWDLTIGTAVFPDDGETVEELLAAADRRLYEQRGIALR